MLLKLPQLITAKKMELHLFILLMILKLLKDKQLLAMEILEQTNEKD